MEINPFTASLGRGAKHSRLSIPLGLAVSANSAPSGSWLNHTYAPCPGRRSRSRGGWCWGRASPGGAPGPSSSSMSSRWPASPPQGSWTWPRTSPGLLGTSRAPPPALPVCYWSLPRSEPGAQGDTDWSARQKFNTRGKQEEKMGTRLPWMFVKVTEDKLTQRMLKPNLVLEIWSLTLILKCLPVTLKKKKSWFRPIEMLQWVKVQPNLSIWAWSPIPTRWKETADSHKLSSGLYTYCGMGILAHK